MRTVLLANNRLGWQVGGYLAERGDLVGVVLHPDDRRSFGDELAALDAPSWTWPDGRDEVAALEPECLLSVLFGFKVPPDWLDIPSWRALNLHPGLLPWNGGANPNVWPLVDGSPAGTTLQVMAEEIDAGDVLCQEPVEVRPDDTAETLYRRLEETSFELFRSAWPTVRDLEPTPQAGEGSYHRTSELASLDPTGDDLAVVDRLRARTFPPHGAEFERDGHRYRITVDIEPLD